MFNMKSMFRNFAVLFFALFTASILLESCNKENPSGKDDKEDNFDYPSAREFYHYMEGVKFCTDVKVMIGGRSAPDGVDKDGFVWCPFDCNSNAGGDYVYIGMKFEPWNAANKHNYIKDIKLYAVKDKGSSEDKEEYDRIKDGDWSKSIDGCTYHVESNRVSLNSGLQIERRYNVFVIYTKDVQSGKAAQYVVNHSFEGYCNVFVDDASVQNATDCTRMIIDIGHPGDPSRDEYNLGPHDNFMKLNNRDGYLDIAETNYGHGPTTGKPCHRIYPILCTMPEPQKWEGDLANWMSYVDDNVPITELCLPGSHDTYTDELNVGGEWGNCQQHSIDKQLELGARVLDMRVNDALSIVHGIADTKYNFIDEIKRLRQFLDNHKNEFIFLNLQDENVPSMEASTWVERVDKYLFECFDSLAIEYKPGYTLKDVRGKILIFKNNTLPTYSIKIQGDYLQRVDGRPNFNQGGYPALGFSNIHRANDGKYFAFYCQNLYEPGFKGYDRKIEYAKNFYEKYDKEGLYKDTVGITYYSAAIGEDKPFRFNSTAVTASYVNPAMYDYLFRVTHTGWVHMDYYGCNFARQTSRQYPYKVYGLALAHLIISKNQFK